MTRPIYLSNCSRIVWKFSISVDYCQLSTISPWTELQSITDSYPPSQQHTCEGTQFPLQSLLLVSKNWTADSWLLSTLSTLPHCIVISTHTLSGRIGKVVASHAAVARSIPLRCTDLYYARGAQGVLPIRVGGATSQLDLPSLTPLSVDGCGWLQLGVPQWPHFLW